MEQIVNYIKNLGLEVGIIDNRLKQFNQTTIKKIVGHKGQGVTETVYTHFELAELKDAINKI